MAEYVSRYGFKTPERVNNATGTSYFVPEYGPTRYNVPTSQNVGLDEGFTNPYSMTGTTPANSYYETDTAVNATVPAYLDPTRANTAEAITQRENIALKQEAGSNTFADNMKTGAAVVNAASGLLGAYTGLKGLGLAEDQFSFNKAAANRDIANQAKLINESRLNARNVGLSLAGNTMTEAQKEVAREKTKAGNVSGSAIG